MLLTYNPSVYNAADIGQAKQIILTPEGSTTELRWQIETPYVADLIGNAISITSETVVLDYGCGIGRLAKELISRHKCFVVGIDISQRMLELSHQYVQSDRFCACSPVMLDALVEGGCRFDAAISIWVLQHCLKPAVDIERVQKSLKTDAGIFILNNIYRAVPTVERSWANDGIDIKKMLAEQFTLRQQGQLPPEKTTDSLSKVHFWASFVNRRPPR
jgi:2-polyprenyl-3-methyl-5-hydroxy-6-metoxy-1,4-benzoquinol methylase